jgi:phage terminase large subunit-like protein
LSFAAIAEADETYQIDSPLGRYLFKREAGDILHPERESAVTLSHIRETIGEYNFSAQYQQNPTPVGGAMVKTGWLQYYEPGQLPERFGQKIQSWDTANKATELSNYSVCTTWGVYGNRYYLLDVFRQRLNYPDLKRKVQELAKRDRPNKILIEDKASGTQDLKAAGLYAITAYQPPSGTDKIKRLHAQTAAFENSRVLLPSGARGSPTTSMN